MGFLSFLVKSSIFGAIVFFSVAFSPYFLEFNPIAYSVVLPDKLEGKLAPNNELNHVEYLFKNEVIAPESLAVYKGSIYTGVSDGRILKLDGSRITNIRRTGKRCEGLWEEDICGRPLGLRFDKNGLLYVADAALGLLTVDVNTNDLQVLISSSSEVDGHKMTLCNDITLDEEAGMVYMTQSSTRWTLSKFLYMLLEPDRSGRILAYNIKTKKVTVLAKNVSYANGIELSHDRKKLIVSRLADFSIVQYHLSGPKKNVLEPFMSNLPGEPDNIRRSLSGNYWIGFINFRTNSTAHLIDRLSQYPLVRKVLVRLITLTGSFMNYVAQIINSPALKELAFIVEGGRFLFDIATANAMIVEVDNDGKILRSLQSTDGKIGHISQVLEHDGYLYLGSWKNPFLGRIKT